MRPASFIGLMGIVFLITLILLPLWTAQAQPSRSSEYGSRGPSYGHDQGMMGFHNRMRGGRGWHGRGINPNNQGWQEMTPEQREQWRQMRSDFLMDTLTLRQNLKVQQMELETLWDQPNPDPEKIKTLSNRINELRSKLDQKYDDYLSQCRHRFGDLGWACPGRRWHAY